MKHSTPSLGTPTGVAAVSGWLATHIPLFHLNQPAKARCSRANHEQRRSNMSKATNADGRSIDRHAAAGGCLERLLALSACKP